MSLNAARPRLRGSSGGPGSAATGGGRTTRRPDRDRQQVGQVGIPRTLGADRTFGITPTLRRQLCATAVYTLTNTSGSYAEQTVTLNTGYHLDGSLDATGFQRYMAFYSKCFVIASRFRVSFARFQTTVAPITCGFAVSTNGTSLAGQIQAIDNGLGKYRLLGTNPNSLVMQGKLNHAHFLGKPVYLDDPQLFCTASAGPSQIIVLHAYTQSAGSNENTTVLVEVVQDVVFTDPIPFT